MNEIKLEMKNISIEFPGVKALSNVNFEMTGGTIHALIGANGAGKSTLMKVLAGANTHYTGEIYVDGKPVEIRSPKSAKDLGIEIVFQEVDTALVPYLSVSENIFLGREIKTAGLVDRTRMNKEAKRWLDMVGLNISPMTLVNKLSIGIQQMVEIAKALSTNSKILIMDEPTSALTAKEIEDLFLIINKLKKEGCGIVYISHRLEELEHIVDRVTILRDGQYINSMNFKDTSLPEIISNMVGRDIKEKFPRVTCKRGKKILEVRKLNAGRMVRNINFDLYEGEIVGIAGLMGAGRTETTRAIFGVDPKASGEIILDGKTIKIEEPMDAISQGIVLVPEDRKKDGLCTKLSIRENIALPNLDIICKKAGIINSKIEKEMANNTVSDLKIKLPNVEVNAGSLSGGNQQKVVVGKWLRRKSRVVIFDEPTRGIDVAAKVEIYNLMNNLKQQGIGVLFVSSELPEILGISDRIIVMCDGKITGELNVEEATQDIILQYATSFDKKIDDNILHK
mgnify:CR=1 FL=1